MEVSSTPPSHFGDRLPELFAGLDRARVPVSGAAIPTSCSPQAWAAASPLLFLRTMLRFDPDIRNARLHLAPEVPGWIGGFALDGVRVLGGRLSFEVVDGRCTVSEAPQGITIVPRAIGPMG